MVVTKFCVSVAIILSIADFNAGTFVVTDDCLTAICKRNNCDKMVNKPPTDGACGPFYIREREFIESGVQETLKKDYLTCCKEMECSRSCVRAYLMKVAPNCTYPKDPTCQDCARIWWTFEDKDKACRTMNSEAQESLADIAARRVRDYCVKNSPDHCN
jgi:hypothetical protein